MVYIKPGFYDKEQSHGFKMNPMQPKAQIKSYSRQLLSLAGEKAHRKW